MVTYATCREWCVRACTAEKLLVSQSSEAFDDGFGCNTEPNETVGSDVKVLLMCEKKGKNQVVNKTDGNRV